MTAPSSDSSSVWSVYGESGAAIQQYARLLDVKRKENARLERENMMLRKEIKNLRVRIRVYEGRGEGLRAEDV